MSFDSGALDQMLAAAVGADERLAADLRATFTASALDLIDLMARARCDANWTVAAYRLKGLSATFGIIPLIRLAEDAVAGAPGDPAILREMRTVLAAFES
jgi:hypothetical protein